MTQVVVPVILAGGKGMRLWPVSREAMPKPYVRIYDKNDTLLQATLRRVSKLHAVHQCLVVCNAEHESHANGQARAVLGHGVRFLFEPEARNTAPAICAAALVLLTASGDDPMLVLPADHIINDEQSFIRSIGAGTELACMGHIVAFAIKPSFPATSYGYIKMGDAIAAAPGQFKIEAFVEKPDAEKAIGFLGSGNYAWNSGIYMFRPSVLLAAFQSHQPDVLAACREAVEKAPAGDILRLDRAAFARAPSISIDYAIMEKAGNLTAVLAEFDWSDIGDWDAVWSAGDRDDNGNTAIGNIELMDSSGSLINSNGPLLVGVGLIDMIAVATRDAIIVAPRNRSQDVKLAVERLAIDNRAEATCGGKIHRPWGTEERLHSGLGFQVRELSVLPGSMTPLQCCKFRVNHWLCNGGEGIAVRDQDRISLHIHATVYIPPGATHRLENHGSALLRIIEIQIGVAAASNA